MALGWPFYYLQREDSVQEVGLELVGPHLYYHVLNIRAIFTGKICIFSNILMKVPVVLPVSLMKNLPSLYLISAWNLEILSSRINIWLVE